MSRLLIRTQEKKILIVGGEEPLRLLYEEELKEEGYHVLTAFNGKEALLKRGYTIFS